MHSVKVASPSNSETPEGDELAVHAMPIRPRTFVALLRISHLLPALKICEHQLCFIRSADFGFIAQTCTLGIQQKSDTRKSETTKIIAAFFVEGDITEIQDVPCKMIRHE